MSNNISNIDSNTSFPVNNIEENIKYFPIFTNLYNKHVLIVGGGEIALRKTYAILKVKANVSVVAPSFCNDLQEIGNSGRVTLINDFFDEKYLDGIILVIAATNNENVNSHVFTCANLKNIFVNVVDDQSKCSFIFPSIVDRDPITIAISSAGSSPTLARKLREKLETLIPQYIGPLARLAGSFREKVKEKIKEFTDRRQFWESVFDSNVVSKIQVNDLYGAELQLNKLLNENQQSKGEVYIVGAGPGDPELLTIKALQLMQKADVVFYDYLVSDEIMELVRRDADLICVGKKQGTNSVKQEDINKMLIEFVKQGKKVCRLKGGDPFIYGRGGEEVQLLADNNIQYQIVPGITAATGCSAYAGIPLTHRDYNSMVQFITGHSKDDKDLDWWSLAKSNQTLVIYMGVFNSSYIQKQLIKNGKHIETEIAIIENGTRKMQRIIITQLDKLTTTIEQNNIISPSLLIIGNVVKLHEKLKWFGEYKQAGNFSQPIIQL